MARWEYFTKEEIVTLDRNKQHDFLGQNSHVGSYDKAVAAGREPDEKLIRFLAKHNLTIVLNIPTSQKFNLPQVMRETTPLPTESNDN